MERKQKVSSAVSNGLFTRYVSKYLGFKGLTFVIATVGLFTGHVPSALWAAVAMSISGMKAWEDNKRG